MPADAANASSRSASGARGAASGGLFGAAAAAPPGSGGAPRPSTSGAQRARPSTAPSGGSSGAGAAAKASSFWKRADDGGGDKQARGGGAAAQSAWGEGPRRPRKASSSGGGGAGDHAGYVMEADARGYASPAAALHYRHDQGQSHLVGGSLSLMRHRRASARDRAQQQASKYHMGANNYGYSQYGFGAQHAANTPSLWGHQQANRHTAWNTAGGGQRAKTPMRPASAVRASSAGGARSKHSAAPPRTRNRY